MVDVVSRIKMLFVSQGAEKAAKQTERVGRAQTRLGQASAASGRQFSAQATGLGGLVSVYAGAAANIFALTMAFNALAKAARAEQVVIGTRTLAREIGASGDKIIAKVQEITDGQLSLVETATQLNAALSAGFGEKQIERLTLVSLKASRALGRDLGDAFNRLVRGAAKLEPELIDELGIFTRIEPAVAAYAAANNVAATSLTNFERRQAFLNAIILEGERKFGNIETSGENAQKSMEKLLATLTDLATEFGQFIANTLTPLIDFFAKAGNQLVLFGAIGLIVFGKLRTVMGTFIAQGINRTSAAFTGLFQKFSAGTKIAISEANDLGAAANEAFKGAGQLVGRKGQPLGIAGARAAAAEVKGLVGKDFGLAGAIRGQELTKDLVPLLQAKRDLKQLDEKQLQNLEGLEIAQKAFNKRVKTSTMLTRGFAITMNKAAGAVRVMGIALKGLMAVLNIVMMVVGALQLVLSFFDIDLFKTIKDLFVDSSQEGRNYKAGLEAIASETLILGGVNNELRTSLGLSKDAFKAATAGAKEYMIAYRLAGKIDTESFGEGFMRALDDADTWFSWAGAATTTLDKRNRIRLKLNEELAESEARIAVGAASRADEAAVASLNIAKAHLSENRGVEALAGAYIQLGMSQARAVEISQKYVQQAATSLGPLGRMTFIIPSVVEGFDTMTIALSSTQAGFENIDSRLNKVADAAGNFMDRQLNLIEAMTSGNMTAEQSAAALDAYKNTAKKLTEELKNGADELHWFGKTNDAVGEGTRKNIQYFQNLVRQMQVVATTAKTLRSVFSGSIKLADQLLAKGKLSIEGMVAETPLEERANQLAFLKATAVLTGNALKLKGELGDIDSKIRHEALMGREEEVTQLQKDRIEIIRHYKLEASLLMRQIELSDASTKAMVGNYIKAAAEAAKLVVTQERYNLKLQGTIDKLKGQMGVQEAQNRLKILQSEQKIAMDVLKTRQDEFKLSMETSKLRNKALQQELEASKKRAENLQTTVDLERKLTDVIAQRDRNRAKQDELRQQNRLAAEADRLDIMGPMATPEQRRQAAIDIAEYTHKLEMERITREEALANKVLNRSLADIQRREDVVRLEQSISARKYLQAFTLFLGEKRLAADKRRIAAEEIAQSKAQIAIQSSIAFKQAAAGDLNALIAFEQRKFELNLLREKYEFLKAEQAIDAENLAGLALFLQGFGEQVALFRVAQGEEIEVTKEGKARAVEIAQAIKDSFGTDVTALGGLLDVADEQNLEIYHAKLRQVGETYRTQITLLENQETLLASKAAKADRDFAAELEAAQAKYDIAEKARKAEAAQILQRLKDLEIERKIARETSAARLAELEVERIAAQEQLAITKRRAAAERDVMFQLGKDITSILQDKLGGGIQDLFKALREGTLTMDNFKEGAKDLALDILGGIQEAMIDRFFVKPLEDLISNAMASLFPDPAAEAEKAAEIEAKVAIIDKANIQSERRQNDWNQTHDQKVFVVNWPSGGGVNGRGSFEKHIGGTGDDTLNGVIIRPSTTKRLTREESDRAENVRNRQTQAKIEAQDYYFAQGEGPSKILPVTKEVEVAIQSVNDRFSETQSVAEKAAVAIQSVNDKYGGFEPDSDKISETFQSRSKRQGWHYKDPRAGAMQPIARTFDEETRFPKENEILHQSINSVADAARMTSPVIKETGLSIEGLGNNFMDMESVVLPLSESVNIASEATPVLTAEIDRLGEAVYAAANAARDDPAEIKAPRIDHDRSKQEIIATERYADARNTATNADQAGAVAATNTAQTTEEQAFLTDKALTGIGVGAVATFASIYSATGDFKKSMIATFLQMFTQIALMAAQSEMSGGASSGGGGIFSWLGGLISGGGGAASSGIPLQSTYGDLIIMASGGSVRKFAGGGVMQRDRVPVLLEPGEFVIRKPMAKAIGGPALQRMNGTGQMPAGGVEVNLINKGTPQQAEAKETPKLDGKGMVIEIVLTDLKNNGPIKQAIRGGGRR